MNDPVEDAWLWLRAARSYPGTQCMSRRHLFRDTTQYDAEMGPEMEVPVLAKRRIGLPGTELAFDSSVWSEKSLIPVQLTRGPSLMSNQLIIQHHTQERTYHNVQYILW